MEAQALAIPPHILINARSGREKVADIVRAYGGEITEDNYFEIIDELRSFFSVTKYAADKRLREFGYRIPRLSGSSRRFNYQHRAGSGIVYDISFDRLLELDDEEKYPDFEGVDITYLKDENENEDNEYEDEDDTAPKKKSSESKSRLPDRLQACCLLYCDTFRCSPVTNRLFS